MHEVIDFRRSAALPGVEVLDAINTDRRWRWFNTAYALAFPTSWFGEVQYRGRLMDSTPGTVFCSAPGEIHATRVSDPGTFHVLLIDPSVFQTMAREAGARSEVTWGPIVDRSSPILRRAALSLFKGIGRESDPLTLQARFSEFFTEMGTTLLQSPIPRVARSAPRRAAQIREALHGGEGRLDLVALTEQTGLNRFQLLRTFKQAYGVSPQTYQLCLRVSRARELLKRGLAPSAVAAECGFADQSHLGRHFKRIVGVTPGRYRMAPIPALLEQRDS